MDIRIDEAIGRFKFRVCGILQYKGKYLIVKMNENPFYCLPGGHVELGEDTNEAVLREMEEELGYKVKIQRLVAINQNFFEDADGRKFHELGFYYIVNAENEANITAHDYEREELDKGKLQHLRFKWASKDELKNIDFRPGFIVGSLDKLGTDIVITKA